MDMGPAQHSGYYWNYCTCLHSYWIILPTSLVYHPVDFQPIKKGKEVSGPPKITETGKFPLLKQTINEHSKV